MPRDDARLSGLLRELAPQVLGALVRRHHDLTICEDAVQEALLSAASQWMSDGLPEEPRAWLMTVASRRRVDLIRSEASRRAREATALSLTLEQDLAPVSFEGANTRDDTLDLLFMCCHPALSTASAIALTLRAVGGLTTLEIARAFFVPEATMAQRISRAKQTIRSSGVAFERPDEKERAERLSAVLHVLYLIFNEGYTASAGPELQRTDLAHEALRLTRLLHELLHGDCEVTGLLALMLLTDARRLARTGKAGELVPLDRQDRKLWDQAAIEQGVALISDALSRGAIGPYQLQAAIAAVHDEAESTDTTDWPQILALYGLLQRMSNNPMVALNHTIALAMVQGPEQGLERLSQLAEDPRLAEHYRIDAVRAHLCERAGQREAAIDSYRRAAQRTSSQPERDYLLLQAARLSAR